MSVSVEYKARVTVTETLPNNTGSTDPARRVVTHDQYNEEVTITGASTPPATLCAHFLLTLTAGAATVDLRTLTGTNGAVVDGNGLKPQVIRIKNLGANTMTFKAGASNPHNAFSATNGHVLQPGGHIQIFTNDNTDDIDATHKTWDVTGTGTQTAEVTIVMG